MYPVSLDIEGKLCVVVGGGTVAARKVRGLIAAGGRVRIVSPVLNELMHASVQEGSVEWRPKKFEAQDLDGAFLVFAATDSPVIQEAIVAAAHARKLLVNVADGPDQCDFQVPAVLRRGDLSISIATGGKTPAVAALVRRQLERVVGEEYALLTALVGAIRQEITGLAISDGEKKILFQKMLQEDIVTWLRERQWHRVQSHIEAVIGRPLGRDLEVLIKENP
ncbi:bifunctional precorrin-2 dehydrogenase/sirohydrochlorin ferrochelatase [Desulfobulbus rhabdoformis]|jgi:precorrin-2 dehydrogenase/sirohydrochlorin ferrochelatase|uniref:precorrin-2 dehydrogenase/sirohydrochlorin ferrochelatase family protein n=1 Tax=Desulfobulbus rhabdoformis TaxID=34032 RepID=UPI0019650FDC|nr:bifunctional precorrin-2 dehydrogenase/sirohydrochlorin ferrochelatase [Desulfobulbus rhabdoformis]MBM9613371.1 bifunctional precorrin-2 dehydrogenase/sirohydrochlorin ferrochelatase [Desulfobulbus rhabdoformis]